MIRAGLRKYESASNLEFNEKIKNLIKSGRQIYHFGFGESPFPIPSCLVKELQQNAHRNEYLPSQEIIKFHREYDHFEHFSPDRIAFSVGTKELIYLTINVFAGDIFLISPSWTSYRPQIEFSGHNRVHIIPTYFEDKYVPTGEMIEKMVAESSTEHKLLILNSPNNPTGISISEIQLKDIANVCKRFNITILSDEIYARLHYDANNYKSIANYYPQGTIVTSGYSKWASAGGWRTGYALFPDELTDLYNAVISGCTHTFTCAPAPMQYALANGLAANNDQLRDYMIHCRRILQAVGEYAHGQLQSVGIVAHRPDAAYYFMPNFEIVREKFKENASMTNGIGMCQTILNEANVALMPCDPHFMRPKGELTARLCFVNFNGANALQESQKIGLNGTIDNQFVIDYCRPVVDGIAALTEWIRRYS